jgi:WD40 repeat protein
MVKCWDLEYNKVIRHYHGHLSAVFCMKLHPTLDLLMTGGRDSVCRVWDMRTKHQVCREIDLFPVLLLLCCDGDGDGRLCAGYANQILGIWCFLSLSCPFVCVVEV